MWHQFGILPDDANKGIFLQIGDIPQSWLQNHYEVFDYKSPYNNYEVQSTYVVPIHKRMKSFSQLLGFDGENSAVRLGELKEKMQIREAVVAIPYVLEGLAQNESQIETGSDIKDPSLQQRKKFISIPKRRYLAARKELQGSLAGDSLNTAGASIRRLMQQMEG